MEFLIFGDLRVELLISDSYQEVYVDAQCLNFVKASNTMASHSYQNLFYKTVKDFRIISPPFCSDLIPGFEVNTPTELC